MSKTKQQIRQDLDAILAQQPHAIGAVGPIDVDKLAEGIHELQSSGAINPAVLSVLKMALAVLPFLPIGPVGAIVTKILEYVIQILEQMP